MIPKVLRWSLACTLVLAAAAQAQRVDPEVLGDLDLAYVPATATEEAPGPQLLLTAEALPGDAFELHLPFRPNRFSRLVSAGHAVTAGTAIARVVGPELAAWLLEADGVTAQFAQADARFRSNQKLFEAGALSAAQWKAISETFYFLQQEMHHVEHVREVLRLHDEGQSDPVVADVLAPVGGRVTFPPFPAVGNSEITVATFIAPESLRLTGQLTQYAGSGQAPVAFAVGDCRVPVAQVEAAAEGLARRIWSEADPACLELTPGAAYAGRPLYAFDGYVVPRAALLRSGGRSGILLRRGSMLEFVAVEIAAEDEANYYLRAVAPIDGAQILVRSVSAVQGILLGLGRD